ncbi:threonine ammonia-lyase [Chitinasiproducens palmae]|uniref:L-threonine ammonia-lyase n=1 Tax=Chitinasiproducens palmae TaxID=1770053 RepID=A0A1H2PMH7_9BURK|nr:pyridoxal-phosphate dependent enzyme [Chitinasiproducens palmae]SDV47314.1 L-threonine ammonia-lyase [Chitinasiproducens palmae]
MTFGTADLTLRHVQDAATRIRPSITRTPVVTSRALNARLGADVFFKCENFQRTGAFKMRGASNAAARLSFEERARGVISYSSGNHAQALALAASSLGMPAVILMPLDAPPSKIAATLGYGAEVVHYDRYQDDRFKLCADLAARRGLVEIPPCEHFDVMAGQGTVALELLEDVPDLDALLVQVGGGGLISGCATVAKALRPSCDVVGVEPCESDDAKRSLAAGTRITIPMPVTIADGQASGSLGEKTFCVIQRLVDDILLVDEAQIKDAMRFLFERMKLVAEPSGATTLAALMTHAARFRGKRVGVVISGGNIAIERFVALLDCGAKEQ